MSLIAVAAEYHFNFPPSSYTKQTGPISIPNSWSVLPTSTGAISMIGRRATFCVLYSKIVLPTLPLRFWKTKKKKREKLIQISSKVQLGESTVWDISGLSHCTSAEQSSPLCTVPYFKTFMSRFHCDEQTCPNDTGGFPPQDGLIFPFIINFFFLCICTCTHILEVHSFKTQRVFWFISSARLILVKFCPSLGFSWECYWQNLHYTHWI